MGCGSSVQAPGQLQAAASPQARTDGAGDKKLLNIERAVSPEDSTANNSVTSQPTPVLGGPKVLQAATDTSIPKEAKLKKGEDIANLTYLQKIDKHAVAELNISRWTGRKAVGQPLDVPALATALGRAKALHTLYAGKNDLNDGHVRLLGEALLKNKSLTKLSLDFSAITADGAAALAKVITSNKTLTYLDLNNNKLSDRGAGVLSEALTTPACSLKVLNLNNNGIGAEGAEALARGLQGNSSLETLSISLNKQMKQGCDALVRALDTNHTLGQLLMMQSGASLDTSIKIKRALRRSAAMKELRAEKAAFLLGCLPTVGKKANASPLYTGLVQGGQGYDRKLLETIWTFMHN